MILDGILIALLGLSLAGSALAQSGWTLWDTPTVHIQGTAPDGTLRFEHPSGATRLSNGFLVIGDGTGAALRFFDASGKPVRSVGRHGSGPGEFQSVSWLGQCQVDSLFVWDAMLYRFTVADGDGRIVRQFRLVGDPGTFSCSRSGIIAVLGFPPDAHPPGRDGASPYFRAPLTLFGADGRLIRTVDTVPAMESRPLGKVTTIAAADWHVYVGVQEPPAVHVYGRDGARQGTIPVGSERRRPTDLHYQRAVEAQVTWLANRQEQKQMERLLLRIPKPAYLPPYSAVHSDSRGLLWVVLSIPGDGRTRLRVLDLAGATLADFELPLELRVFEVGDDYVLGAWEDSSGEPHVGLFALRRPEP